MKTIIHTEKEIIEEVIRESEVCYVGMTDSDGTPYVLPMNFGYKDGIVYLHSAPEGKKISILEKNPRVCITFCVSGKIVYQHPDVACSYSMKAKSVIGWGDVEFEDDMEKKREILSVFMKQYSTREFTYNDPAVRNVKIWRVCLENLSCKEFGAPVQRRYM